MMLEKLQDFSSKVLEYKTAVKNESQTRTVLIEPVLKILGYDVANPFEVIHEYTCDIGTKQGEKVDYAVQLNNEIVLLIEAKDCNITLGEKAVSQLYRYYGVSTSKIAVLTNGIEYWFFADTKKQNIMDETPFYKINITDINEEDVSFLLHLRKDKFDNKKMGVFAKEFAIRQEVRTYMEQQSENPSKELINFITRQIGRNATKDSPALVSRELKNILATQPVKSTDVTKAKAVSDKISNVGKKESVQEIKKETKKRSTVISETKNKPTGNHSLEAIINYGDIAYGKPLTVTILGEVHGISNWSELAFILLAISYTLNPDYENALLIDGVADTDKGWLAPRKEHMKQPKELVTEDGIIYLDTHSPTRSLLSRMRKIADFSGIPLSDIIVAIN